MSPDTIFAAQMWNWPDAVIKRNAQGQVVLVNAAFLAMYGGTVEAWSGNAVTGWSAPPAPGTAIRFETRLPAPADAHGQSAGEMVFDWIESAAPDGSALAIARNVTHIQPQPGQPAPEAAPVQDSLPEAHSSDAAMTSAPAAPVFEPVMQDATPASEPVTAPPVTAPPVSAPPVSAPPILAESHQEPVAPPVVETPALPPVVEAAADVQNADVDPILETQSEPSEPAEGEREFERRALPIEDGSAVLGNNWRDAVIAKAVGATGAQAPEPVTDDSEAPELPAGTGNGEAIRILLAEDNAINALLTRTLLEAEGCIVDTVEDGALAVEAMKVKTYDLIFMDMRMPNMDGLESTRKIRQMDHRSKGLPIIALTANAFDDDRNACFDAGMNDFMTKPVSAEELSEMVTAWTGEEAKEKLARMA